MADDSSQIINPEIHKYAMIEFISPGRKPASKASRIDFVPYFWIDINLKSNKSYAKFPTPPYDETTSQKLNQLQKNREPPAKEYKPYAVKIVGRSSKIYTRDSIYVT